MNTPDPSKVISPKVTAAGITGVALTIVGTAVLGAIQATTPEHFASFGLWSTVIYGAVVAGGAALAGYLTTDPLRR